MEFGWCRADGDLLTIKRHSMKLFMHSDWWIFNSIFTHNPLLPENKYNVFSSPTFTLLFHSTSIYHILCYSLLTALKDWLILTHKLTKMGCKNRNPIIIHYNWQCALRVIFFRRRGVTTLTDQTFFAREKNSHLKTSVSNYDGWVGVDIGVKIH